MQLSLIQEIERNLIDSSLQRADAFFGAEKRRMKQKPKNAPALRRLHRLKMRRDIVRRRLFDMSRNARDVPKDGCERYQGRRRVGVGFTGKQLVQNTSPNMTYLPKQLGQ